MTGKLIEKQVDIYQYPQEMEGNSGSITIGDLHGNAVKLVHFLLRHKVVELKPEGSATAAYDNFVDVYEQIAKTAAQIQKNPGILKSESARVSNYEQKINRYDELKKIESRTEQQEQQLYSVVMQLADSAYYDSNTDREQIKKQLGIIDSESAHLFSYEQIIVRHALLYRKKSTTKEEANELESLSLELAKGYKAKAELNEKNTAEQLPALKQQFSFLIDRFNQFMAQLKVVDNKALVRLIGDELADRGSNDYFTLRVLSLLKSAGVVVHVTISNHSNEFITAYERLAKKQGFSAKDDIGDSQKMSFVGLKLLMEQGLVTEADVSKLVNDAYKPTLRVIDYELSDDGINLFSHAPVSFEMIKHVAAKMKVAYADSSKEALAATIDKINTKFMQEVNENRVHEWCKMTDDEQDQELNRDNMTAQQMQDYPLINLIWNRWTDAKDIAEARPANHNGYKINYLHGHDGHQSKYANVVNLDTDCGKRARSEASKNQATGSESNMLDPDKVYKVWDSSGRGLDQKHSLELIDKEFMQQQSMSNTARAGIISGVAAGIGLLLGAAIGIALVATGVFAPLGLGVLGIVAMAAILGGGASLVAGGLAFSVAKVSEAAPVTTTLIEDAEPLIEKSSLSVMASGLGSAHVEPASQSTNSPGQEPEPQSQSQANVVATAESNPDEVHEAHSCSPK